MSTFSRLHVALVAAFACGLWAVSAQAASNKVYRCTGDNGKVTLSDRRCPDDDAPAAKADAKTDTKAANKADGGKTERSDAKPDKTDAPKPGKADVAGPLAASPASGAVDQKVCSDTRERIAGERRRLKALSDAERKALKALEDEHRRTCGA